MRKATMMSVVLLVCGYVVPIYDTPATGQGFEGRIPVTQAQTSNRCYTPTFYCFLPQAIPVGYACWCATPYGPVAGVAR